MLLFLETTSRTTMDLKESDMDAMQDPAVYRLPPLYTKDKRGVQRIWTTWAMDGTVHKRYGVKGGTMVVVSRKCQGKNVGRKNATTAPQQARAQAQRDWAKQLDKGYAPAKDDPRGHSTCAQVNDPKTSYAGSTGAERPRRGFVDEKVILPMHTTKFEATPKCLKYFDFRAGVYVQPKLDGWRCIARLDPRGDVVMTTRTGKRYPWFVQLRNEIKTVLQTAEEKGVGKVVLDGEIYAHQLVLEDGKDAQQDTRFNMISAACNVSRKSPHAYESQLQYFVFDLVAEEGDQTSRFATLTKLKELHCGGVAVQFVPHTRVEEVKDIYAAHDQLVQEGYEGVIIRAHDLPYIQGKRSNKMRKYKNFHTEEYTIIGAKEGEGTETGCVIWMCQTQKGKRFEARPRGTREEKQTWWKEADQWIGSLLTVRFQELTAEGVPRFPVGLGIRTEFEDG